MLIFLYYKIFLYISKTFCNKSSHKKYFFINLIILRLSLRQIYILINKNMEKLLAQYKEIEKYAHISFDDIMNKVSQEIAELIEAKTNNNENEIQKEASDVLINLLSISQELWVLEDSYSPKAIELIPLVIKHWKWNSDVNAFRNRYSKTPKSLDEVRQSTKDIIENILSFIPKEISINDIIKNSTKKIDSRKDLYKPKINLWEYVKWYKDFPKKWINFRDISPLLKSPEALQYACFELANSCKDADIIAWLDSRWFLLWNIIAQILNKPFVMIRKAWKLPWETKKFSYWLEYWKDTIEIQTSSIKKWQKVALIDDLLATWWTIDAAINLVESLWWIIELIWFAISLDEPKLKNSPLRKKIEKYKVKALLSYND